MRRAITLAIAVAASMTGGFAEAQPHNQQPERNVLEAENANPENLKRINMRVSRLYAGTDAVDVERVLGRPTSTTVIGGSDGNTLALCYADEPILTSVTLVRGRVTAIALDLLSIDIATLSAHARMLKPRMTRGAVFALLGRPQTDETWLAFALEIEQMVYARADEPEFSVFLADGLVIDVRAGVAKPPDIERLVLPAVFPDGFAGPGLSIGLKPSQASVLVGRAVWESTMSALKGQPALYATHQEREGSRYVSLTFTGGTLTAFSIWSPDVLKLGETSAFGDR